MELGWEEHLQGYGILSGRTEDCATFAGCGYGIDRPSGAGLLYLRLSRADTTCDTGIDALVEAPSIRGPPNFMA